jgi:hypothetical protein
MHVRIGSVTKGDMYVERFLHPGNNPNNGINGVWLVKIGETQLCEREPDSPAYHQHDWPVGTLMPASLLTTGLFTGGWYDKDTGELFEVDPLHDAEWKDK